MVTAKKIGYNFLRVFCPFFFRLSGISIYCFSPLQYCRNIFSSANSISYLNQSENELTFSLPKDVRQSFHWFDFALACDDGRITLCNNKEMCPKVLEEFHYFISISLLPFWIWY